MQVARIMSRPLDYIGPETPIRDVAQMMRREDIGFLGIGSPIELIGVVTDRDIVTRAVASGRSPQTTPVMDVMTHAVYTIFEDDEPESALTEMESKRVRRLVVVRRDGRPVGLVSLDDLASYFGGTEFVAQAISNILQLGSKRSAAPYQVLQGGSTSTERTGTT